MVASPDFTATGKNGARQASRYAGATASGAPTYGAFDVGDFVIDRTGVIWICTAAGIPGTWVSAAALALALTGGAISGLLTLNGGTDTAGSAPVLTPTFASGTAAQLTDVTRDYMCYFQIGTGGGTVALAIGPTSTPANAILTAAAGVNGELITVRLPAGWYLKITVATSTIADQVAIGC